MTADSNPDRSPYPPGHPCHPKPFHTHATAQASRRCERLRKRLLGATMPERRRPAQE